MTTKKIKRTSDKKPMTPDAFVKMFWGVPLFALSFFGLAAGSLAFLLTGILALWMMISAWGDRV